MANHLVNENSPYLLQHVDNPVDWYPWGDEALRLAKEQDKPILLSIGYAACHWCHVMAHESFEDERTAALMNQHFVNIKVDREERPDLDSIYMDAVVSMTGQGGWPMTVILTPDGRPFFGGTYYPPTPRFGLPSFQQVLAAVADAWQTRRDEIEKNAAELSEHISRKITLAGDSNTIEADVLVQAVQNVSKRFDHRDGGFGPAPKFPQAMTIEFLLRQYQQLGDSHALFMAEYTLKKMAYGGMYDQIGGGFARYATDSAWLVPHFEKMLYDNALLARVYLHAWQITGNGLHKRIVEESLDYVLREMRHPDGGFFSSLDADSEGEEGKFYVWDLTEIQELLGEEAELFVEYFGVSEGGNWEGKNILNVQLDLEDLARSHGLSSQQLAEKLASARKTLYEVRARRIWPGLDDKVITAWNGLMLAAFAEAGSALNRSDYTMAAEKNAAFLYQTMRTEDGRLKRSWKSGSQAKTNGFLDDYAHLADGLLALYQNTFDQRWFTWARELADQMIDHFLDEDGGFYDTSDDHEELIYRPKDVQDNAVPSGNAMAAAVLLKMSLYTGEQRYWEVAEAAAASLQNNMIQAPIGFGQWLTAAAFILGEPQELAIIGKRDAQDTMQLVNVARDGYRPNLLVACGSGADNGAIPLLAQRTMIDGRATAYLCRRFLCQAPVTEPELLNKQIASSGGDQRTAVS